MQNAQAEQQAKQAQQQPEDPYVKLARLKQLLDQGVISQEEFDAVKAKVLGV
jgi:membrane protease subunit (stomatin/prohibitin family)